MDATTQAERQNFMETKISNLEYLVPTPDKPIGSLSFSVEQIIIHKEGRKIPTDVDGANVILSEKTVELVKQLTDSIIEDLIK